MLDTNPLTHINARRYLEEVNQYILHNEGEIKESSGKLSLVWTDPANIQRFLAIKPAGDDAILINGRRFPATEAGLQEGLRGILAGLR